MSSTSDSSLFLIVTPSFNQAHFIEQTIESVLVQQTKKIQLQYVVIDGGSTDDTVSILKKYGNKIGWVSEKDKGQTDAINKGIKYLDSRFQNPDFSSEVSNVKGQKSNVIFAYLNSDDYYLPGAFEKVVEEFSRHPEKQWLVGDAVIIDELNSEIQQPIRLYKQLMRKLPSWILFILNPYPQPATFIRWSAVQKVGEFNTSLRFTMDYEYWLRALQKVGSPIVTSQPLAAFRIHNQSKGGTQFVKQFDEGYMVAKSFTSNLVLLLLHKLHNSVIKLVYQVIKN